MTEGQLAFDWGQQNDGNRESSQPPPRAQALAPRLRQWATRGMYLGTSSWKYPGWLGQVYTPARYQTRGRFSEQKFNRQCLAEYAAVFPTVCGDFAFYQFPSDEAWSETFAQVPSGFRFSLKVPEDVTVERFPDLPRYGRRAGQENPHFMDASLVRDQLLARLDSYRDRLGVLIFEFGTIHDPAVAQPAEFTRALDHLLSRLPLDRFRFAVEVRNPEFLESGQDYLSCLRGHGVAHCFNSWTRMPALDRQIRLPGTLTAPFSVARLLLRPGRTYQQAVDRFAPYESVRDPYHEGRSALIELMRACPAEGRELFAFVNNRFEGSAVGTIEAIATEFQ
jgi:uncharacterized protein YecE (DUF72 family)